MRVIDGVSFTRMGLKRHIKEQILQTSPSSGTRKLGMHKTDDISFAWIINYNFKLKTNKQTDRITALCQEEETYLDCRNIFKILKQVLGLQL